MKKTNLDYEDAAVDRDLNSGLEESRVACQSNNAIEAAAAAGVAGGAIYDAVIARCALKAGAKTIFTWNLKHFERLGPDIAGRAATP